MDEQFERHPLAEYFDSNPHEHNHQQYCEIFRRCLPDTLRGRLFDASTGSRLQALNEDDFKPCEDRRLLRFSSRYDRDAGEKIVYKVKYVDDRWSCASSFAEMVASTYAKYKDVRPIKEEIAALQKSTRALSSRLHTKNAIDYDESEVEQSRTLHLQLERLAHLNTVRDRKGTVRTKTGLYAEASFAYQVQQLTFFQFGDAPPGSRGKYSGRGLPYLTAKIVNRLFEIAPKCQFDAKDVSQIYERGSARVRAFNNAHWAQIWGRKSWSDTG